MTVNQPQSRRGSSPTAARSDLTDDQPEPHRDATATPDGESAAAVEDLLELLGDEYVADILRALSDDDLPARTIANECGMSRATVYRRLDRLTELGVVTSRVRVEADGHHRQEFQLVLEEVAFQFHEDGFDGHVRVRGSASD